MRNVTSGSKNVALGPYALFDNTIGSGNVAIGEYSLSKKVSGNYNLSIGHQAGRYLGGTTTANLTSDNSIFLGHKAGPNGDSQTNQIVIGHNAIGSGSNSVTLGATTITKTILNGSVGIGTTSPSSILHLKSDTSTLTLESSDTSLNSEQVWASLDFKQNDSSQTPSGSVANISAVAKAGNTNFGNLLFQTKSRPSDTYNDTLFLSSSGNVGIGTTAPSTPLHINADAPTIRLQDATSGDNHYLTGNNGELRVQSSGYITMRPGAAVSTTFLANGNVGIGTTSPSSPLHIEFNSTSTTFPAGTGDYLQVENTNTTVDTHSSISLRSGTADSFISTVYKGINTGDLVFNLDNGGVAEKMRILANGNVGIGTASPSEKLEVNGNVNVNGGVYVSGVNGFVWNNTANSNLRFGANSGEKMRITSTGNLGIGTTSPSQKLDVAGNAIVRGDIVSRDTYPSIYVDHSGTVMGGIRADATTKLELKTLTTAPLSFQVNSSEKMLIQNNGNVGIGTNSPSQKLEVDGEVLSDGYRVSAMQTAPAARNSTGTLGEIRITSNYIYICYATNSWSRVALATSW
jgi:hypothetical protein